jgi:glycosyltransferase involved in cell wall biosynthesis
VATNDLTVLHVIAARGIGGAEHMLSALVTAKRDSPLSQAVVNLMADPELAAAVRASGVPVYELGLRKVVQMPLVLTHLVKLIRTLRPAAIQSWLYYSDLLSLWALNLSGRRTITRLYWGIRCSDMDLSKYRASLRWTVAACAKRSQEPDAVIANSYAGLSVHRQLGYTPQQFAVIPNGIDCERFKPDASARTRIRAELRISETAPVVIHVARVDPVKDHASLIAVAGALPNVTFIVVGQGTNALAVHSNVIALGARRDVASLYSAADLALFTSINSEGFPNVVAEAMACGLPVVATDVGDASRIVADTGLIVPPRDIAAMVAAIQRFLDEPLPLKRQRALACRNHIEQHFSLDRAVTAFDALHQYGTLPSSCV